MSNRADGGLLNTPLLKVTCPPVNVAVPLFTTVPPLNVLGEPLNVMPPFAVNMRGTPEPPMMPPVHENGPGMVTVLLPVKVPPVMKRFVTKAGVVVLKLSVLPRLVSVPIVTGQKKFAVPLTPEM